MSLPRCIHRVLAPINVISARLQLALAATSSCRAMYPASSGCTTTTRCASLQHALFEANLTHIYQTANALPCVRRKRALLRCSLSREVGGCPVVRKIGRPAPMARQHHLGICSCDLLRPSLHRQEHHQLCPALEGKQNSRWYRPS